MTFSKTQRWLLVSAAALAFPSVLASWWMLASRDPAPAESLVESISHGKAASMPSISSIEIALRQGTQPHPADAGSTAEGNTDADDFQQYATALRAQGHPETTVRELTASRITAAFQTRRATIRSQARQGTANAAEIQAQLAALGREQGALIGRLLGAEESAEESAKATAETFPGGDEKQVLMPAVMAEAMPATVQTGQQAEDWEKLRGDFVNAIGGANQNPANAQYRKRWVQAQSEADRRFRLMFGDNAFVAMQLKAQNQAARKEQAQAP